MKSEKMSAKFLLYLGGLLAIISNIEAQANFVTRAGEVRHRDAVMQNAHSKASSNKENTYINKSKTDKFFTKMMAAAADGNLQEVEKLKKGSMFSKSQLCLKDSDGWTALMYAALEGKVGVIDALLAEAGETNGDAGMTALMIAIKNGNFDVVQKLKPYEEGYKDVVEKKTALMYAAMYGSVAMMQLFLHQVRATTFVMGKTALMLAGSVDAIKLLLPYEKGMREAEKGMTALQLAIKNGDVERVRILAPSEVKYTDLEGKTPFEYVQHYNMPESKRNEITNILTEADAKTPQPQDPEAIKSKPPVVIDKNGNTTVIADILQNWARVPRTRDLLWENSGQLGFQNQQGKTVLMVATEMLPSDKIPSIVPLLLPEAGKQDSAGKSALMISTERKMNGAINLLAPLESGLKDNNGNTALIRAIDNNNNQAIAVLAPKEGRICDKYGDPPIKWALQRGNIEAIKLLIPVALGQKDKNGMTTLMHAVDTNNMNAIPLLLQEQGIQAANGQTALMIAASEGNIEAMKLLLSELGKQDANGKTALMHAIENKKLAAVQLLLSEIGKQDANGKTALMRAVLSNNIELVKLFLAEMGLIDKIGYTALKHAVQMNNPELVLLLLSEKNVKTCGLSPRDDAKFSHHERIMQIFEEDERASKAAANRVPAQPPVVGAAQQGTIVTQQPTVVANSAPVIVNHVVPIPERVPVKPPVVAEPPVPLDVYGNTPLISAALEGDINKVNKILQEDKRQIGMKNTSGYTALMMAVMKKYVELVNLLAPLEQGKTNKSGDTALIIAINEYNNECAKLLLEESKIPDRTNSTPLNIAERKHNKEMIDILSEREFGGYFQMESDD